MCPYRLHIGCLLQIVIINTLCRTAVYPNRSYWLAATVGDDLGKRYSSLSIQQSYPPLHLNRAGGFNRQLGALVSIVVDPQFGGFGTYVYVRIFLVFRLCRRSPTIHTASNYSITGIHCRRLITPSGACHPSVLCKILTHMLVKRCLA